jgi:hypothetical protein
MNPTPYSLSKENIDTKNLLFELANCTQKALRLLSINFAALVIPPINLPHGPSHKCRPQHRGVCKELVGVDE